MSKRVAIALAVLLAAAVAALGGAAAAAAADGTAALSPDSASALVSTPGSSGLSASTAVDPSTALAAASTPGAVTSYESDLTLDEAVGLDSTIDATTLDSTASPSLSTTEDSSLSSLSAPKSCWADAAWWQWGTWPYQQKLTDTTYWCAAYGSKITYRTSSVTGSGMICSLSWRASQLIAGGVGFPNFTLRSSGGFSCPTAVPLIVLHPTHYLDVRRNDIGGAAIVGTG